MAMVTSKVEPWVTRRKMVDALTPCLATFGVNKEERKPDEDWDSAGGRLPFALAIGASSGSEAAGSGSLSAGCLAGMDAR